jgi:hypothetical protein
MVEQQNKAVRDAQARMELVSKDEDEEYENLMQACK